MDAIFAIAFVMETAIEIAASGVGGKLQVGVLGPEEDEEVAHSSDRGCEANRRYSARLLEPNEVEEQRAAALGAYEHLAAYRRGGRLGTRTDPSLGVGLGRYRDLGRVCGWPAGTHRGMTDSDPSQ